MTAATPLALVVVAVAVFALWLVAALGQAPTWWTLTAVATTIAVVVITTSTVPVVLAVAPLGAVVGLVLRVMHDLTQAIESMHEEL